MATLEPRTWMEILPTEECWRLLRLSPVARIAVSGVDGPEIYPINVAVDGHSVVFRTDPGSKLDAIDRYPVVAIEADGLDVEARRGWSVVLRGTAKVIAGGEIGAARHLPLEPWCSGDKARWMRVEASTISGRSIHDRSART